jgi:hypothetical protein
MAVNPVSSNAPYSTAVIKKTITCQTEEAKNFLGNKLDNISVALFTLDVISRKRIARLNISSREHKAATKALNKLFTDFEKELHDETARLEAVLQAQGIEGRAEHNNPGSYEIAITTPELKRAMDLLLAFDKLIILVDTVWLMGIMETDVANQFRRSKASQLKRLFGNVFSLSQAAKKSSFVKDDAETQAAIAAEESKLKPAEEPSAEEPQESAAA